MHLVDVIKPRVLKQERRLPKCCVFEDNSGALKIAKVYKFHPWMKHLNVKLHHFHSYVECSDISIHPIASKDQLVDYLIKPLAWELLGVLHKNVMGW